MKTIFPFHTDRQQAAQGRECGACQACCYSHGIEELNKPMFQICPHQCAAGCAIYSSKPVECNTYQCLWLAGALKSDDARPDKCGIIFTVCRLTGTDSMNVAAREVWPNARVGKLAVALLRGTASRLPISIQLHPDSKDGCAKGGAVLMMPKRYQVQGKRFSIEVDGHRMVTFESKEVIWI